MKKIRFFIAMLLYATLLQAQNNGFNYKAQITDNGSVVANQSVDVRFTILENGSTVVYEETQTATTDASGIFIVNIGEGTVVSGDFSAINWANEQFLKVEINTGNGYTDFGTTAFHPVPTAKYADKAGNVFSGVFDSLSNIPTVFYKVQTTSYPTTVDDNIYRNGAIILGQQDLDQNDTKIRIFKDVSSGGTGDDIVNFENLIQGTGTLDQTGILNTLSGDNGGGQVVAIQNDINNNGSGRRFGLINNLSGTGTGKHYAVFNNLSGTATGMQIGTYDSISNSSDAMICAKFSVINSNGSGTHTGTYNEINNGTGYIYASWNNIYSNTDSIAIANYNSISSGNSAERVGTYNYLTSSSNNKMVGTRNEIQGSSSADHCGVENIFDNDNGTGIGVKSTFTNNQGLCYGMYNNFTDNSDKTWGLYNEFTGQDMKEQTCIENKISGKVNNNNLKQIGLKNDIFIDGSVSNGWGSYNNNYYGVFNDIHGSTGSRIYGVYNDLSANDAEFIIGYGNFITGGNTGQTAVGLDNTVFDEGGENATIIGIQNYISGIGDSAHYGVINDISVNYQSTGKVYGTKNIIQHSGTDTVFATYNSYGTDFTYLYGTHGNGIKYGTYNYIPSSVNGTHIAVYGKATKSGSYAGQFIGDVEISQKLKAPTSGDADMKAYVYGFVGYDGTNYSDRSSSGYSISKVGTGIYKITLTSLSTDDYHYVVSVTSEIGGGGVPVFAATDYVGTSGHQNEFYVKTYDLSGNLVDNSFHFVVYKK